MPRITIPRSIKDKVLKEFNHRCAICGADKPHIHHIDENPSNNNLMNLIPLCPNCHLLDQHNPTAPIDPRKLSLFRQYKDPAILTPQFEPLFRRILFLVDLDESTLDVSDTKMKLYELISFVKALKMGEFYGERIHKLTYKEAHPLAISSLSPHDVLYRLMVDEIGKYYQFLNNTKQEVISLIIELLRYQDWHIDRISPHKSIS